MNAQSRILIIDDDQNIRKVVSAILQDQGYIVDTAESGTEAIDKTSKSHFDIMLVDIRLPDMEGTELLHKVHDTSPRIRKIIVTGYPTLQNAVTSVNSGADAYLMKPFDVEKMLDVVKEQLEKQAQERKYSEAQVAAFIETRVKELNVK
jgi:DNA-binding NtrC family response regulator